MMPKAPMNGLLSYLKVHHKINCMEVSSTYACRCSPEQYQTGFPDLNFTFGNANYYLPKESYVIYGGEEYFYSCSLKIMSDDSFGGWIFGLNFFENYFTVFDQQEQKVGFAVSKNAVDAVSRYHQQDRGQMLLNSETPLSLA